MSYKYNDDLHVALERQNEDDIAMIQKLKETGQFEAALEQQGLEDMKMIMALNLDLREKSTPLSKEQLDELTRQGGIEMKHYIEMNMKD